MIGEFDDSISKLKYLKQISIFNGDVIYEKVPNVNANQIKLFPPKLLECLDLEEINMINVGLAGDIGQGIVNLTKLRFLNLS